ncbi:MAG: HD domain-containing protein [Clostridia bacterium]|nr:HD domain-containing protein [Clostridia bacterium]
MLKYNSLSKELQDRIKADLNDDKLNKDIAVRRRPNHDKGNLWRPAFVRDAEKIMHSPYYNRYTDKTQVFSLYKNDDISRRALHVQLVSRIARNIGRMLNLDLDLIEAIALGHDIGHTPFGHAGEKYLNRLYNEKTGRYFHHNVHSVRVLDGIFNYNISLQTLDGILCHNGEFELGEYKPAKLRTFSEFDAIVEQCYISEEVSNHLLPCTLEGCVVRICDMIAYLGKDRQDAIRTKILPDDEMFKADNLGTQNAAIINNMIVNIIENSYGKDYIRLDDDYFNELKNSKKQNYTYIYDHSKVTKKNDQLVAPMFEKMYQKLLIDLITGNKNSPIYIHHIDYVNGYRKYYGSERYEETEPNQIVVDYIASMTDDYFVELFDFLFPKQREIKYHSYFEDIPLQFTKNS